MNSVKNLVILAGGKNTRFKEMSIFPKILLPFEDEDSILTYNIKMCEKLGLNPYLVINKDYENMVRDYVKNNHLNIIIIASSNTNGSANTIKEVKKELPKTNTLLVWSDLILDQEGFEILIDRLKTNSSTQQVIVTRRGNYRFRTTSVNGFTEVIPTGTNPESPCGNIPGIYYYSKILSFGYDEELHPNMDYVEYLALVADDKITLGSIPWHGGLTEFKDLEVYKEYYMKNTAIPKMKTRYFNYIDLNEEKHLVKSCCNKDFNHLIEKEIEWYSKVKDKNLKCIPKIFDMNPKEHYIEMEYLDGYVPVHRYLSQEKDKRRLKEFFDLYFKAIEELHNTQVKEVAKDDVCQDCTKEFYTKVLDRCDKISGMIVNYNREKLAELLKKANQIILEEVLVKNYPYGKYYFTHGDLNGSNVLYNEETKDIKFIDPRGYFGETKMLGLKEYDYAKVLYCLLGYDQFNDGKCVYTKSWYHAPTKLIEFGDHIPKELFKPLYQIMVGIIYIALAQYISQDIFKVNIAYDFGFDMLTSAIEDYELNQEYERYLKETEK
jgi:tRNA A-37 threonylcarbamoyl transferase component Bud32